MASEESDEVPMLARFAGVASTGSVELSNLSSSSSSSSSRQPHTRSVQERRYFSGRLQPTNGFFSGPLQRTNGILHNSSSADHDAPASLHNGFYSGPIPIGNEATTSSSVTLSSVSRRVGRREHRIPNEHLLRSGPLGKCDDPFCTTCPLYFDKQQPGLQPLHPLSFSNQKVNRGFILKMRKLFSDSFSWGLACLPGVMNPHTKRVQQWNKVFLISCLLAVFVDPLFFFILSVNPGSRCIYFNLAFAKVITVLRSATDLVYLLHMLLQCHVAYLEPSSVGTGVLNDKPIEIVKHYLTGWFILDLVVVLPLPQIMIWVIIPKVLGKETVANFAKNLLRIIILLQYLPRMIRFFPLLAGNSSTGFIFETAWSNFFINLSLFLLVAHVVGSCWYFLSLQRVNQCLRDMCVKATSAGCNLDFLDCGDGGDIDNKMRRINASTWDVWLNNSNAKDCLLSSSTFGYGIYSSAVNVIVEKTFVPKYIYSLFWGFQASSPTPEKCFCDHIYGNQV